MIRSEPSVDSRAHRYRAEDVRALEGSSRAPSAEPQRVPQFRCRAAGARHGGLDHHRGRAGLSRRRLRCARRDGEPRTRGDAVVGCQPRSIRSPPDNMPVMSEAMQAVAHAARHAAPIERAIAVLALGGRRRSARVHPRRRRPRAGRRTHHAPRGRGDARARAVGGAAASAARRCVGAGAQGCRRPVAAGAGAARRSRAQRLDLHGALRRLYRPQSL